MLGSAVGLARVKAWVHAVRQPVAGPMLLLEALWMKLLKPTGAYRRDSRGRRRAVKAKHKVALLVALALWPNGQWQVLDWALSSGEDEASGEVRRVRLESRGVYAQRGLRLILHDGHAALIAALERI